MLNLQWNLNRVHSLRNQMFWSVVFGFMVLIIFKQMLLNFDTCNHFKVVKCLKHLGKVKRSWKRLFSALFLWLFRKGCRKTKRESARMKSRRSFKLKNRMRNTFNHGLNGISLHHVGFELFKKVLFVTLGIWLSISYVEIANFICTSNVLLIIIKHFCMCVYKHMILLK